MHFMNFVTFLYVVTQRYFSLVSYCDAKLDLIHTLFIISDFNMRLLASLVVFALIGLLAADPTPTSRKSDLLVVTKDWFNKNPVPVLYTAEYDIVKIAVPLNSLNFEEDLFVSKMLLFFVEADVQADGSKVYKGLYVLKDRKVTKVLENGRDIAAVRGPGKEVYFGATDGIYVYNPTTNAAEKYGTLTDSIRSIEVSQDGDVLYILTDDNEVYKVTDNGTKKVKVQEIEDAKEILVDYADRVYFYSDDKQPWVYAEGEDVKKIEGLPEIKGEVKLVRPPFVLREGVVFVANNQVYLIRSNGESDLLPIEFSPEALPTASAPEAALAQYYALDKKLYEYNVLNLFANNALDSLDDYFNKRTTQIRAISSKRGNLKRKLLRKPA